MDSMSGDHSIDIVLIILLVVFSSSVHETFHAWVASLCGDDTAKNMGRISLNPMVHISPLNSILLPALIYYLSEYRFIFAEARPVPINPAKLRNPDRDMALTAGAGPLSNILLVAVGTVLLLITKPIAPPQGLICVLLINFIVINLILAFFNLIPIPPLDGSRIFRYLFPQVREFYNNMDTWGILVLIFILFYFPGFLGFIYAGLRVTIKGIFFLYASMPW